MAHNATTRPIADALDKEIRNMEKAGHIHDYGMIRVIEVFRICYIGFMLPMGDDYLYHDGEHSFKRIEKSLVKKKGRPNDYGAQRWRVAWMEIAFGVLVFLAEHGFKLMGLTDAKVAEILQLHASINAPVGEVEPMVQQPVVAVAVPEEDSRQEDSDGSQGLICSDFSEADAREEREPVDRIEEDAKQLANFMDANGIKWREEMHTFLGLPQSPKKAAGAGASFTSPGGESPPPAKRLKLASPPKRPRTEGGVEAKNAKRKLAVFDQAQKWAQKTSPKRAKLEVVDQDDQAVVVGERGELDALRSQKKVYQEAYEAGKKKLQAVKEKAIDIQLKNVSTAAKAGLAQAEANLVWAKLQVQLSATDAE